MEIEVSGVVEGITKHHTKDGKGYYRFFVKTKRLSGTTDKVKVVSTKPPKEGEKVLVKGHVRTANIASRLDVYVYAKEIEPCSDDVDLDIVKGFAYLTGKNDLRITFSEHKKIIDCFFAHNYKGQSAYIPTIAWGLNAQMLSGKDLGGEFYIVGRLQSREYTKMLSDGTCEVRTAYELSIKDIQEVTNA